MTEHQRLEPTESPTSADPAGIQPEFQSAEPRESTNGQTPASGDHGQDTAGGPADRRSEDLGPLFDGQHAKQIQQRRHDVQAGFVDDPHDAIRQAGELNDEVVNSFTSALQDRKHALEQGIANGDTEQLQIGLRQYRHMLDQTSPSQWPIESQADADDRHRAPDRAGGCGAIRHGQYPQPCRVQHRQHRPGRAAFSYDTGVISVALRAPA